MKTLHNLFLILLTIFVLSSCNKIKKENPQEVKTSEIKTASLKSVEVTIEGMTCEIGCAKTIESKLAKVDGVTFSKVSFEAKQGVFTFDQNKLSKEDIQSKIDGIAGGDLYKAISIKELPEIVSAEESNTSVN